ncbi:MAG: hypothetical protein QE493_01020, partial [Verrucomicrobiae bacterium]|nr:hypothetical protein [Verrucomicrobiae bacterium]
MAEDVFQKIGSKISPIRCSIAFFIARTKSKKFILLTRIFHTDHLRRLGSQMDAALISKFYSGSMKHTAVV